MGHLTWQGVLTGATLWSIIGYAVNTVPTSDNVWIRWFIGILKFGVGQHQSALNMVRGQDTVVAAIPRGTPPLGSTQETATKTAEVGPDSIKVTDEKKTTTEVVIPTKPAGTGE